MPASEQLPFHSFAFTLIDNKRPRAMLRLSASDEGFYELHVEKGSASRPASQFTRQVPVETAQRLKDALQSLGVFGWDEEYGDSRAPGSRRWRVSTIFKEGVFSVSSRGGSDVPVGFDDMLEELYRLDFPRPDQPKAAPSGIVGLPTESMGFDFGQLADLMGGDGLPGFDAASMTELLDEARSNPQALQNRMREEFRHMPREEQDRLLDALASSGMASRAWWERFFRGM